MSGERWLKILGLFGLLLICAILALTSGAKADEKVEVDGGIGYFIDFANDFQDPSGSWEDDINVTIFLSTANYEASRRYEKNSDDFQMYFETEITGMNWICSNYERDVSIEAKPFLIRELDIVRENDHFNDTPYMFRGELIDDLLYSQLPNGSWNGRVSDTSMAVYGLAIKEPVNGAVDLGVKWLQDQKDDRNLSWGSIEDDSKALLALESTGIDIGNEMSALMQKQRFDGSFGGIRDTSWALMGLSTKPNKETMESMRRAMTWLRAYDYENIKDLAIAALAEQYYENARFFNKDGSEGNGFFGTLPRLYVLSIFIIGSFALSYWLFAKLDKNEILSGVRLDIYQYITEHPGEYIANITKNLNLSPSSVVYHLSVLEGMDYIVSHKNGKYKRYYINRNGYSRYTNGNGYKHIMSALKNNTARKIIKFLLANPDSNQKKVSESLNIHPSTVNWHAKRLREAEIISKHRRGKEIIYSLNQNVQLQKVIGIIEG